MIDPDRRTTLKLMALGGATAATASLPAWAAAPLRGAADAHPAGSAEGSPDLVIQVIDCDSFAFDTLMLSNTTDAPMRITQFLPATLIYGDKHLDLNALTGRSNSSDVLELPAGHSRSWQADAWRREPEAGLVEYVWANDAVEALTDETRVYKLGAFLADQRAIVFPDPRRLPRLSVPA